MDSNTGFLCGQCYKDLGQKGQAKKMCEAACLMDTVSKEVCSDLLLHFEAKGPYFGHSAPYASCFSVLFQG